MIRTKPTIVALTTVLVIEGCSSGVDGRKHASMMQIDGQTIGGIDIKAFATARSGAILTGADEVDQLKVSREGVQGVFRSRGRVCKTVGGCAAVPIDARGYWLTAGHCADPEGVLLHTTSSDGTERGTPARIVWRSSTPGQDLAIIFAPFPSGVLPVSVDPDVRVGAQVVCVGSGIESGLLSAGRVVGAGGSTDGSVQWVEHDAPLFAGDSGGAVFYLDGRLAGINFEAGHSRGRRVSRATALVPDMEMIAREIEADVLNQPGQ